VHLKGLCTADGWSFMLCRGLLGLLPVITYILAGVRFEKSGTSFADVRHYSSHFTRRAEWYRPLFRVGLTEAHAVDPLSTQRTTPG
jgi:hypothetical protein